jgi:hypothetical protein
MSISPPNRLISPHEMSIILSGVAELESDFPKSVDNEGRWNYIREALADVTYSELEIEQVEREWRRARVPHFDPITVDVNDFGDAAFEVQPNVDAGDGTHGVQIKFAHIMQGDAYIMVSADEADDIVTALQRAARQQRGLDPDRDELEDEIIDRLRTDSGWFFNAGIEAANGTEKARAVVEAAATLAYAAHSESGKSIGDIVLEIADMMRELHEEMVA